MIICHCEVVTDRAVAAAIDDGARTLAQVCQSTGAGQTCGGCVFSVKQVLCQHGQALDLSYARHGQAIDPSYSEVSHATGRFAGSRAAQ